MADERSPGLHLSDKHLVFLIMSAGVVAVAVFLFGVMVGRGVRAARGPLDDAGPIAASQVVADGGAAEAPAADSASRQGGSASAAGRSGTYTYPDRLGSNPPAERLSGSGSSGPPAPRPSAAPPDVPSEPIARPRTTTTPAAGPPAGKPSTTAGTAAPSRAAPGAGVPPAVRPIQGANVPSAAKPKPGAGATTTAKPAASGVPAGEPAAGTTAGARAYTVQIAAVTRREEADAIVTRLKTRGYEAYVFVPDGADRRNVFRVRVGSFKDKREADALAQRLQREDSRYQPWVTR
jgi:cell division septation protein DedD